MSRASYSIVSEVDDVITLKDNNGRVSVTNDAEAVVREVIQWKGRMTEDGKPWRIHYIDSMGNKDELVHSGGEFKGFAPVQTKGRNKI